MFDITLDDVTFKLKEFHDFSWLRSLGKVFCVFDQNDSGNISFGINNGNVKYFVKAAGLRTAESVRTPAEAISSLKSAIPIYEELKHPNLIELVDHYSLNDIYIAIFKWAEGDCLFDHWNFEKYRNNPSIAPPAKRFKNLPIQKRIRAAEALFSFLSLTARNNYVAVDFYDGSIMYDFKTDAVTICDIDFFRRKPTFNDIGEDYFGTKRLKAPEEYVYGAKIDEATNVYTLGALLFGSFFGNYNDEDIQKMYRDNEFFPCEFKDWDLNRPCYDAALKAVNLQRNDRYASIDEFYMAWAAALKTVC